MQHNSILFFLLVTLSLTGCEESKQVWQTKITNDYPSLSSVPCRPKLPDIQDLTQEKEAMKQDYSNSQN